MNLDLAQAVRVQGYVDERTTRHISGWMRNLNDATQRLGYEVFLGEHILATGIANAPNDNLALLAVGDGAYAFHATFIPELTAAERDQVQVRFPMTGDVLELSPAVRAATSGQSIFQGYVSERSTRHIAGWVRDLSHPEQRTPIEIVLPTPGGERVLQNLVADRFSAGLQTVGVGDGAYSFYTLFEVPLAEAERDMVFVRPAGTTQPLELAPKLRTAFEPINHIAMDIVNNCNLRCPFCTYDYAGVHKTEFMTDAVFDSALRLIPYVTDGNFWLSCLHEATLHPRLLDFIKRVPLEYRRKLFFTTNLAKRMPVSYFEALADSRMSHFNISLESLVPATYERMRKGARIGIFLENWERLLSVFGGRRDAPRIRYNLMAYRSNLDELPSLTEYLLRQRLATQVEIRNTYDGPQIPQWFRDEEFLTSAEWASLAAACRHFGPEELLLLLPPGGLGYEPGYMPPPPDDRIPDKVEITPGPAPRPFQLKINWQGKTLAYAEPPRRAGEPPSHLNYLYTNITALEDPLATLFCL